jgi:hypothetical protein
VKRRGGGGVKNPQMLVFNFGFVDSVPEISVMWSIANEHDGELQQMLDNPASSRIVLKTFHSHRSTREGRPRTLYSHYHGTYAEVCRRTGWVVVITIPHGTDHKNTKSLVLLAKRSSVTRSFSPHISPETESINLELKTIVQTIHIHHPIPTSFKSQTLYTSTESGQHHSRIINVNFSDFQIQLRMSLDRS